MNNDLKFPLHDTKTLELLTRPYVERGERLAVAFEFARLVSLPFVAALLCVVLWQMIENVFIRTVLAVVFVGAGGMAIALLFAFLHEIDDQTLRLEQWKLNLKSTRLYIENSAPDIENLVIQRGKTNVAQVGNTTQTQNIIGADALKELNRQYQVASLMLELLAQAKGRKPKPFKYETVREACTARGIPQPEVTTWQESVKLLEAGEVLENGAAPTAWKQVKYGELAQSALDKAMRDRGLSKSSHNNVVEWKSEA